MIDPEPVFIMGMMVGALTLWAVQTFLRLRRGRTAETTRREATLIADNERRVREIDELQERLAVLERIATDPAARTVAEIEKLR